MEDMNAEYGNYWDTKLFLDDEELNSCWATPDDPILSCSYESSSPEGIASNIIIERNRRRKLNDSLYALRSVVPNITKMDKASIIKDAIECIQQLQREEKKLVAEVGEMEQQSSAAASISSESTDSPKLRKKRVRMAGAVRRSPAAQSIDVTELSVCDVGERTLVASIACGKKKGTMIRLSQVIESLDLKIITASFTSLSGMLLHTLFIEADDLANGEDLKGKIEAAVAEFNFSTMSCASI